MSLGLRPAGCGNLVLSESATIARRVQKQLMPSGRVKRKSARALDKQRVPKVERYGFYSQKSSI